jgi:hypothetical protein
MELSDLVEGFELLRSASQPDTEYSETGRNVLLHDDGFVRVYLTAGPDNWEDIMLEIEVFIGVSPNSINPDDVSGLSRTQLIESISYIEYMLRLEAFGFNLDLVLDGCIWTARLLVQRKPDSQLFRIITPPKHQGKGS